MITGNEKVYPFTKKEEQTYDRVGVVNGIEYSVEGGLTIREHFASLAMQGYVCNVNQIQPIVAAEVAVRLADALIEEINKPKE